MANQQKALLLRSKLKSKLDLYGQTFTRKRPPYTQSSTRITTSDSPVRLLDADSIGKRYQDINRYLDVNLSNQANQDLTIYYAIGNADIQEGDILVSLLAYQFKVTKVHPFVLQDVPIYLELTIIRERKIGVQ